MDRAQKKEQVESIDDEVKVLHPLLEVLLRKIDHVTYVEYTHGTKEMGADFVVERNDPAIREVHHIGVIVKAEKILQNFSEVERQIDECRVRRFIRQGKQEVRLQEVWVVTSKSISQNAKDKINDKFSTQKIHFFTSEWLVDLIDQHYSYYWHQLPNATGSYLASLAQTVAEINAQSSVIHVPGHSGKYIELDVEAASEETYKRNGPPPSRRLVNLKDEVLANKITIVEGEMGAGKSSLARHLVTHFAGPTAFKETNVLPIYQSFTTYLKSSGASLEERLKAAVGEPCYQEAEAAGVIYLLVLDGVDEATADLEKAEAEITDLVADVRSQTRVHVLLTTRPFKLLENIPDLNRTGKRYRVRPLTTGKLIKFLQEVCNQVNLPKSLYQDLAKSDLFKQLPHNPIAAALLSTLLAQKSTDLPSNMTELYSKSIEFMLGRWDERKGLSTEKLFRACERLARELARFMIDHQLVYVSRAEARGIVEAFLKERNLGVSAADVFDYLVDRSQLFGFISDTDALFFRHRSFAEYLYALDAYERRDLHVDHQAFHPYWVNVYFFYFGLLGECPKLLEALVELPPEDERARWMRLVHLSKYLLAGYQSPYAVVQGSTRRMLREFAQLYLDVKYGRVESKITSWPEMRVLWLFARLIESSFSYEFFKQALLASMVELDDDPDDEIKLHALFFSACVLGDLGDGEGFSFFLKRHETNKLPLSLSLAIQCEVEYNKDFANDPDIKRHEKQLRRMLAASSEVGRLAVQHKLDNLFHKPLSAAPGQIKKSKDAQGE